MRLDRVDFVGVIEVHRNVRADRSDVPLPTPGHAPATLTREGYLDVDALLARDGLLTYSDGTDQWTEYRPRAELVAAAASWAGAPVTDNHPKRMVDASSWADVARGITLGTPTVEVHEGVGYLRARLRITDAELIRKIESGQRELSIGFTSEVLKTNDGIAPDGTRCDAIQTSMIGNHNASVERGRAGPACRVLLDSAAWTAYGDATMTITTQKPTPNAPARRDAVGPAVEMAEYPAPDGTTVQLPTWVVAMLTELQTLKAAPPAAPGGDAPAGQVPAPAAAPAVAPVAPVAPVIPAAAPVAAAVAPVPPRRDEVIPPDEQKKTEDAFKPIRRKLDRLAVAAGITDDVIDSPDPCVLARAYLGKVAPAVKTDKMDAAALVTAIEVVSSARRNDDATPPWGGQVPPTGTPPARNDAAPSSEAAFMKSQGYT